MREDGRRGRRRIREKGRKLKRGMGKECDVGTVGEWGRRTAGGGKGGNAIPLPAS